MDAEMCAFGEIIVGDLDMMASYDRVAANILGSTASEHYVA